MSQGATGALILVALLAVVLSYGAALWTLSLLMPAFVVWFLTLLVFVLLCELLNLLQRIITRKSFRSFWYFIVCLAISMILYYKDAGIVCPVLTVIAVDILGRCIWSLSVKKNSKSWGGYIPAGICVVYLCLGSWFLFSNKTGSDRVKFYNQISKSFENKSQAVDKNSFDAYMADGPYETEILTYGIQDDNDIKTSKINLTPYADYEGVLSKLNKFYFGEKLDSVPVEGKIYLPKDLQNCPVLFMVHGNHRIDEPSYLGYEYLGNYLSSNGYVVISVNENYVNFLSNENDARAVLLLENIKKILELSRNSYSPLYNRIDPQKIALAGHSRGGETIATAYLFKSLRNYPNNGSQFFNYNFKIKSLIAIAPTVDQYMPADHSVKIQDVNYLYLHGMNDQDVIPVMAEKQYNNVTYSGNASQELFKASVYILGANHGQFNSEWGLYDTNSLAKYLLNVSHFLSREEQQQIAKTYIRIFLDTTLLDKEDYKDIFYNSDAYSECLPETVYQTSYETNSFVPQFSFDEDCNIKNGSQPETMIVAKNFSNWREGKIKIDWANADNYGQYLEWNKQILKPEIWFMFNSDAQNKNVLSFRIADNRKGTEDTSEKLDYTVCLYDQNSNKFLLDNPALVYPSLAVQLKKIDILRKKYEYKHQFQTVRITKDMIDSDSSFDFSKITKISIRFNDTDGGSVIIDQVGFE